MKEKTLNDILSLVINDNSILGLNGCYEAIEILLDDNSTLEDNLEWVCNEYESKREAKVGIAKSIIYILREEEVWEEDENEE